MICYSVLSIFLVRQFVVPAEASVIENMHINHAMPLLFLIKKQTIQMKTTQNGIRTPAKKGQCSPQPHPFIFHDRQKMYQLYAFSLSGALILLIRTNAVIIITNVNAPTN